MYLIFFTKNPHLKKKTKTKNFFFVCVGGGGGGGGPRVCDFFC